VTGPPKAHGVPLPRADPLTVKARDSGSTRDGTGAAVARRPQPPHVVDTRGWIGWRHPAPPPPPTPGPHDPLPHVFPEQHV